MGKWSVDERYPWSKVASFDGDLSTEEEVIFDIACLSFVCIITEHPNREGLKKTYILIIPIQSDCFDTEALG